MAAYARSQNRSPAMLASLLLHAGLIGATLVVWPWARQITPVQVTPVTLMTSADLARLTAARDEAQFNLDCCTVRAPANGIVTQLTLRPGQLVVPMPWATVMTFIHDERIWIGSFPQQTLQNIDPDDKAEVAITSAPGHVFSAKVIRILPALAEGALSARGSLYRAPYDSQPGRIPVLLEFTDERIKKLNLPVGSDATATVFTSDSHVLALVRGILMRIHSWEMWIF